MRSNNPARLGVPGRSLRSHRFGFGRAPGSGITQARPPPSKAATPKTPSPHSKTWRTSNVPASTRQLLGVRDAVPLWMRPPGKLTAPENLHASIVPGESKAPLRGALQNLADRERARINAPASWSAGRSPALDETAREADRPRESARLDRPQGIQSATAWRTPRRPTPSPDSATPSRAVGCSGWASWIWTTR